ncbi:elongin-A3-like [Cricetulus griseus]|uniref:Elongin-A3-like n=1 Tax=Cricetulus griseus TaxID=10029 RepID=A0A9J7H798_CRIGR|nr:elongin-A3-like [Cricetulus griseus]
MTQSYFYRLYIKHALEALKKLRERLCMETEPRQLYKTLKKLSSLSILCKTLEEIGFRQTIKRLKKQQLLVPFAKEFAARWSERSKFGSQPEPGTQQDFAFHRSPKAEIPSNSPEDKPQNPDSSGHGEDGSQVLEVSSSSPQPRTNQSMDTSSKQIATHRPKAEPAGRRTHRGSFWDNQLDTESLVRVDNPQGTVGESWTLEGLKTLSSKPEPGPAKQPLSPLRAKRPGPWTPEDYPPGSFEAWLKYDCNSSSSALPPHKRKKKSTQKPEAHTPRAKMPPDGPENSDLHTDQEAATWTCRKTFKTSAYSGSRPARHLPHISNIGRQAKPQSTGENHGQPVLEEDPLWSEHEEDCPRTQIKTANQTVTQTETQKLLRMQESLQLTTLCASIQSSQAKNHHLHQTKLIDFDAQARSPSQHADSGPRGEVSPENVHRLPEKSGHGYLPKASCQLLGVSSNDSHKTQAKKPAPLMVKAFKDYKNRWARK